MKTDKTKQNKTKQNKINDDDECVCAGWMMIGGFIFYVNLYRIKIIDHVKYIILFNI